MKVKRSFGNERENPKHPMLCRALDALVGCSNLEELAAPVGKETLRCILSGVKGLRILDVDNLIEDFTEV